MASPESLSSLFQELNLASYVYIPIDSEASEIRLLTLHPSPNHSDKPEISIQTTTLTSGHVPKYEALSYSWGKHHNLESILVTQDHGEPAKPSTHLVTHNLAEALRYLRYEKEDRVLWIDAICIDQSNLTERSEQVLRMGEIYTKALRVIAWLGPSEGDESSGTKAGLKTMKEFSDKVRVNWATGDIHPFGDDDHKWANIQEHLPFDLADYMNIKTVIDKPWFTRLWIWQEIRLGSSESMVVCGKDTMLWGDFRKAVFCLSFKKRRTGLEVELNDFYRRLRLVYPLISVTNEGTNSLERLLEDTQQCEYADPRDRIFSILSLLNYNGRRIGLTADYTKPVHKVYQDVVLKFIKGTCSMNIVNHCEMPLVAGTRNDQLPSWVPDWENQKNTPREAFVWQHASSFTNSSTELLDHKILAASGVKIGVIDAVDRTDLAWTYPADLPNVIRRLAPPDVLKGEYAGGGSLLSAFCRSVFWGVTSDRFSPPLNVIDDYETFETAVADILSSDKSHLESHWITRNLYTYNMRCAYFTTKEGYLGYAPKAAEAGDILVVLRGLDVVMALRPIGSRFQVIGGCYVHGFMNGEALLGPIPKPFEAMLLFDKNSSQYWRYFQNRETKEFQADDPRLGPLPPGWIEKAHSLDHVWTWFWNEETGEDGQARDPRFTTEQLLKRGVNLETFELV